jgi:hypothetical protein
LFQFVMEDGFMIVRSLTIWVLAAAFAASASAHEQAARESSGQQALAVAAQQQKHLFLMFYKQDDAATQGMWRTLQAALAPRTHLANSIAVRAGDPAEKPLIDHWALSRSPMPLVLAVAPNGAVTGGFAIQASEQELASAIVSPGTAACLRASQAKKLVLLCIHAPRTPGVPAGVQGFQADPEYGPVTEVVHIRADDPAEAALLHQLQVKPAAATQTVFLAPPGSKVGVYPATVTKQQLVAGLKAAQSGCCPGGQCGPGGCCPGGKCEGGQCGPAR